MPRVGEGAWSEPAPRVSGYGVVRRPVLSQPTHLVGQGAWSGRAPRVGGCGVGWRLGWPGRWSGGVWLARAGPALAPSAGPHQTQRRARWSRLVRPMWPSGSGAAGRRPVPAVPGPWDATAAARPTSLGRRRDVAGGRARRTAEWSAPPRPVGECGVTWRRGWRGRWSGGVWRVAIGSALALRSRFPPGLRPGRPTRRGFVRCRARPALPPWRMPWTSARSALPRRAGGCGVTWRRAWLGRWSRGVWHVRMRPTLALRSRFRSWRRPGRPTRRGFVRCRARPALAPGTSARSAPPRRAGRCGVAWPGGVWHVRMGPALAPPGRRVVVRCSGPRGERERRAARSTPERAAAPRHAGRCGAAGGPGPLGRWSGAA
ncbi:hypothetical protein SAMN04515669_1720 [Jiangella sp. DSM 45060]|nr:hypothetical protein SAMN04515669_1720 [Jiangella sp. DSM 45060]